jgi:hypothetical protein
MFPVEHFSKCSGKVKILKVAEIINEVKTGTATRNFYRSTTQFATLLALLNRGGQLRSALRAGRPAKAGTPNAGLATVTGQAL